MATKKPTITAGETLLPETLSFKSLSDFAYAHASLAGKVQNMARYAIDNIAGFPAECPDESKAELKAGYHKRWGALHPAVTYVNVGGNYVPEESVDVSKMAGPIERRTISAEYLMNLTTHEYGIMGKEEPKWREHVEIAREAMKDYATNRYNDLVTAAKKLIAETTPGAKRTRNIVLFTASVQKAFDGLDKSVKIKAKAGSGDTTANPVQFRMAVDAFWKAYNNK
ncbi:MAG: hypothetical protein EBS82_07535 [Methylocystaceae bacterium]|nr:hypothetical protein [Methylocystaceae bacterium]